MMSEWRQKKGECHQGTVSQGVSEREGVDHETHQDEAEGLLPDAPCGEGIRADQGEGETRRPSSAITAPVLTKDEIDCHHGNAA